jgi:hypothetical protein
MKRIEVEDFAGIRKAEIDGPFRAVGVTGRNNQGKSSLLHAISWLLTGKGSRGRRVGDIVRLGSKRAAVTMYTDEGDEFRVERTDGGSFQGFMNGRKVRASLWAATVAAALGSNPTALLLSTREDGRSLLTPADWMGLVDSTIGPAYESDDPLAPILIETMDQEVPGWRDSTTVAVAEVLSERLQEAKLEWKRAGDHQIRVSNARMTLEQSVYGGRTEDIVNGRLHGLRGEILIGQDALEVRVGEVAAERSREMLEFLDTGRLARTLIKKSLEACPWCRSKFTRDWGEEQVRRVCEIALDHEDMEKDTEWAIEKRKTVEKHKEVLVKLLAARDLVYSPADPSLGTEDDLDEKEARVDRLTRLIDYFGPGGRFGMGSRGALGSIYEGANKWLHSRGMQGSVEANAPTKSRTELSMGDLDSTRLSASEAWRLETCFRLQFATHVGAPVACVDNMEILEPQTRPLFMSDFIAMAKDGASMWFAWTTQSFSIDETQCVPEGCRILVASNGEFTEVGK